jgi:phosphosulfolactate phosphohydrolase-like enzyme
MSIEDAIAAGAIVEALSEFASTAATLDDGARTALLLYADARTDLRGALAATDHGASLVALGLHDDIEYCARLDIDGAVVPALTGSTIRCAEVRASR